MDGTGPHSAFAFETFWKTGEFIIVVERPFRAHFMLRRNDVVLNRKSTLLWLENSRTTSSSIKSKLKGLEAIVPENVQTVRLFVMLSPARSAFKHVSAFGLSDRTVRRIISTDSKFHPNKLMVAHEVQERDCVLNRMAWQTILQIVPADAVLLSSDETHFHFSGYVNKLRFRYSTENKPRQVHIYTANEINKNFLKLIFLINFFKKLNVFF